MSVPLSAWPVTADSGVRRVDGELRIFCDAFGCGESHPIEHELLGDECFGTGRWLGWIYVDLNRPDLWQREMRFCSVSCAGWWIERETLTRGRGPLTPLDKALRQPTNEFLRKQAGVRRTAERDQ